MVNLLPENDFRKAVHKALRQVGQSGEDSALARSRLVLQVQKTAHVNPHQAAQEVLEQGIVRLEDGEKTKAELLRLRYFEGRSVTSLTAQFSRSEATLYREQQQAVQSLTNLLWPLEIDAQEGYYASQYSRLESPTYTRLFGIEDLLSKIQEQVQQPGSPWLILLQTRGS